MTNKLN